MGVKTPPAHRGTFFANPVPVVPIPGAPVVGVRLRRLPHPVDSVHRRTYDDADADAGDGRLAVRGDRLRLAARLARRRAARRPAARHPVRRRVGGPVGQKEAHSRRAVFQPSLHSPSRLSRLRRPLGTVAHIRRNRRLGSQQRLGRPRPIRNHRQHSAAQPPNGRGGVESDDLSGGRRACPARVRAHHRDAGHRRHLRNRSRFRSSGDLHALDDPHRGSPVPARAKAGDPSSNAFGKARNTSGRTPSCPACTCWI